MLGAERGGDRWHCMEIRHPYPSKVSVYIEAIFFTFTQFVILEKVRHFGLGIARSEMDEDV